MTTAIAPVPALRAEIIRFTPRMIEAVGMRGADEYVQRQVTLAMLKIKDSPDLQKCSVDSIATALIRLCGERLECGSTAHLVPMKGQCVYMRDWKGDVELMIRAGHVRDVKPYLVHERDLFREYVQAGVPQLDWSPAPNDRGPIVRVFVVVTLPHGLTSFEVMSREEIEAIRAKAPMPNSLGWKEHWGEMGKKTVIHRVSKRFPKGDRKTSMWAPDDTASDATLVASEPRMIARAPDGAYGDDGSAGDLGALLAEPARRTTSMDPESEA